MPTRDKTVTYDAFPDSVFRYLEYDAVVCIDIIRATTTLVTAVAQNRRAYPVANTEQALVLAGRLEQPLLAGETATGRAVGFELQNSPAALALRTDVERPLVLLSSIGTEMIVNSGSCRNAYIASLQNLTATADAIARRHDRVAVLAACSRGQLRCEDELAAGWLIGRLVDRGFAPEDPRTSDLVKRWSGAETSLIRLSSSAEYLRRSGQLDDLEFVIEHVDDLDLVCRYEAGEVKRSSEVAAAPIASGLSSHSSWLRDSMKPIPEAPPARFPISSGQLRQIAKA